MTKWGRKFLDIFDQFYTEVIKNEFVKEYKIWKIKK